MNDFGLRLKQLRDERDLTMDMLVSDLKNQFPNIKVEKSMVSRWEKGINSPTWENVKYLSMYFNVSLDYLAGLTDVRTPSRLLAQKRILTYSQKINGISGGKNGS